MLYSMVVTLVTTRDIASIMENIGVVVKIYRGKLVKSSDGTLLILFGSKFWTRLIGVWYGSELNRFQLATQLRVEIANNGDENHVVLNFVDNLGLGLPDPYSDTAYQKYFGKIRDNLKEQLSAKEFTTSSEQGKLPDIASEINFNDEIHEHNFSIVTIKKHYPGYYWWCVIGIFWFFPFGLIATVYASQAAAAMSVGNHSTAIVKERVAKRWLVATGVAGVFSTIWGIYYHFFGI